jgi:outer membrane protein assembly factor BamB
MTRSLVISSLLLLTSSHVRGDEASLARWTHKVRITPVLKDAECHSIHAYFNCSPESPDGKRVVLFTSSSKDGHEGQVRVIHRHDGSQAVLADNIVAEDAHRAACQQWNSGGKRVVYHNLQGDEWVVVAIDVDTGKRRVLARNRHVGFGAPGGTVVPVVGLHWSPGQHTGLELIDTGTGAARTVVTADAVRKAFPDDVKALFGERPISIYFPVMSPDGNRVFFKLATSLGGDFRSKQASQREGLICFDLRDGKLLWMHRRWGHPAWHRDGVQLINVGPVTIDAVTGEVKGHSGFPPFPGSHPSFSPDGLFTTDAIVESKPASVWSVVVGDLVLGKSHVLHRFDNSQGAASWRRSHPHPVFSADGKRLYFNVSADRWTRLYVAERE